MHLNLDFCSLKKIIEAEGDILPSAFFFKRIASLEYATGDDVAIVLERGDAAVFDVVSPGKIAQTNAACVIASHDVLPGKTLVVQDALAAYQALVDFVGNRDRKLFFLNEQYPLAFVSRDAHVDHSVTVGPGAVIMPGAVVNAGTILHSQSYVGVDAVIGTHVTLYPGAKVLDRCIVGDHSILHAGAIVGSDGFGYQVTQRGLRKIPQVGIVRIGKHVELGANVTIDRAAFDETLIDDGAKLDNLVSIAHNAVVGKGSAILAQTCLAGSSRVGAGCLIGAQVAVRDNTVIGNRAKVVSKSGVMDNIDDGKIVAGFPAVSFTDWKRIQVVTKQLPLFARKIHTVFERKSLWSRAMKKISLFLVRER